MPTIAQIVDEIRAQGIDVRVLWASEGGKTVGRKPQQENAYPLEQNRFRNLTRRTK